MVLGLQKAGLERTMTQQMLTAQRRAEIEQELTTDNELLPGNRSFDLVVKKMKGLEKDYSDKKNELSDLIKRKNEVLERLGQNSHWLFNLQSMADKVNDAQGESPAVAESSTGSSPTEDQDESEDGGRVDSDK